MMWMLLTALATPAQAQDCGSLGATWTASFGDTELTITDDAGTSHTVGLPDAVGDFIILEVMPDDARIADDDGNLLDVLDGLIRVACDDGILELVLEQGHDRTIHGDNGQAFIIIEVLEED